MAFVSCNGGSISDALLELMMGPVTQSNGLIGGQAVAENSSNQPAATVSTLKRGPGGALTLDMENG